MDAYDLGNFEMAAGILKTLRQDTKMTNYYPMTVYMQALASYREGKNEDAMTLFGDFIMENPEHPLSPRARLYRANMMYTEGDFYEAAEEYLSVASTATQQEKAIAEQALDNLTWGYLSVDEIQSLLQQAPPSYHLDLSIDYIKRLKHAGRNAQALRQGESLEKHYAGSPKLKEIKKLNDEISEQLSGSITVGVILPLSGNESFVEYGTSVLNGIRMAFDDYQKSSRKTIDLLIRDSASEPLKCVQVAEELIESYQPVCIIGPLLSDEAVALGTLGGAHKIPIITPTASKSDLATISPYFFQVATSPKAATRAVMLYAINEIADSTFTILAPNDTEGQMLTETAYGVIDVHGRTLVSAGYYNSDEVDFSDELMAIKEPVLEVLERRAEYADSTDSIFFDYNGKKKPREEWTVKLDALFLPPSFSEELLNILPQVPFNYIETKLYGANAWIVDDITDRNIVKYAEGAVFVPDQFFVEEDDSRWNDFARSYGSRFGGEPDRLAGLGYDSAKLITSGLSGGAITADLMREHLAKVDEYKGVTQDVTFDGSGANSYARIYKIEKREPVKIK